MTDAPAPQDPTTPEDDAAHIRKAVELLFAPGDLVELRAKNVPRRGLVSGYYDDLNKLALHGAELDRDDRPQAIYVVLTAHSTCTANPSCARSRGYLYH